MRPGSKQRQRSRSVPSPTAVAAALEFIAPSAPPAPLAAPTVRKRPRDVRDMNRDELAAYAIKLGLLPRALDLPDDRLRQNIMAFLAEMYEDA